MHVILPHQNFTKGYEMRDNLMRVKEVAVMFGVSSATIWNWLKNNPNFPRSRKLSTKTTVWRESELIAYMDTIHN